MTAVSGNILVTDDDPDLRRVLRRTLDALGFDVAESANGEQALKEIEARPFDVVLLDVNMPGIGGIEACRQIRRKAPRLQILMLTLRDQESDIVEAHHGRVWADGEPGYGTSFSISLPAAAHKQHLSLSSHF